MSDEDIYLVPTNNIIQWGTRVYYYNCDKAKSTTGFYKNNIEKAKGHPTGDQVNVNWVFKNNWNPLAN
jgi:pectinesterase